MKPTLANPTIAEQIVAFADLSGYHRAICSKLSPEETFAFLSDYYATVQRVVDGSAGRVVKFIGDAVLLVFPSRDPAQAIAVLRELKTAVDAFLAERRHESRLRVKAHVGPVAAGRVGSGELERFDVCGLAVNHAAMLPDQEWVLSDELQGRLRG